MSKTHIEATLKPTPVHIEESDDQQHWTPCPWDEEGWAIIKKKYIRIIGPMPTPEIYEPKLRVVV